MVDGTVLKEMSYIMDENESELVLLQALPWKCDTVVIPICPGQVPGVSLIDCAAKGRIDPAIIFS